MGSQVTIELTLLRELSKVITTMPIYEYTCGACKKTFDHLARTLSDKPKACPACGSKKQLVKQFSTFAPSSAKPAVPSGCHGCAGASCCPSLSQGGCH